VQYQRLPLRQLVAEDVFLRSWAQANDWSPLEDEVELPGKLAKILPDNRGESSRAASPTNTARPSKPACPVVFFFLGAFDGAGSSSLDGSGGCSEMLLRD
jgi:hypothetical protein